MSDAAVVFKSRVFEHNQGDVGFCDSFWLPDFFFFDIRLNDNNRGHKPKLGQMTGKA